VIPIYPPSPPKKTTLFAGGIKNSSENCVITRKIRWDNIDKGKYENNVKSYLENLTTEIDSFVDITKTLDNLNNIMVKSADDAAPKIKKGKRRPKL
jgi:hypothetical protein